MEVFWTLAGFALLMWALSGHPLVLVIRKGKE